MGYLADKQLIVGEKVVLRRFKDEDFPFIEERLQDTEVIKLTGSGLDFDRETFLH